MYLQKWMLFLWALSFTDNATGTVPDSEEITFDSAETLDKRQNDRDPPSKYPYLPFNVNDVNVETSENRDREWEESRRCMDKMEGALESIRRRQMVKERMFQFQGYTLHQPLRTAPLDMYVTDMRVRLPPTKSWVRVQKCNFDPISRSLETRLMFNDLTISGRVNLYNEDHIQKEPIAPNPEESCHMILRLRKAGIGFHTEPIRRERGQFNVKTDSHFLEPGFISVYAYGCEPALRRSQDFDLGRIEEEEEETSREMEDVFLKGIRSLLTTYMQKELQPAIKETLMKNMGYTVSYG
ncbi:uncharacterized protein LOC143203986 [Rhynchophorus ferrugineus]|uniref:Uncharacterized protein n=1 Tax=Rhynchophorus ferrugineus TaxID=354439 RepID=A0A834M171_RHYFE|nr:hypothetical protein GWI33_019651 [Rhynchophorus ferrugineus]